MDEFRIIPPEEIGRERLFKQAVETLELDLKIAKIEYQLSVCSNPPLIITNGDKFNADVTRQSSNCSIKSLTRISARLSKITYRITD